MPAKVSQMRILLRLHITTIMTGNLLYLLYLSSPTLYDPTYLDIRYSYRYLLDFALNVF